MLCMASVALSCLLIRGTIADGEHCQPEGQLAAAGRLVSRHLSSASQCSPCWDQSLELELEKRAMQIHPRAEADGRGRSRGCHLNVYQCCPSFNVTSVPVNILSKLRLVQTFMYVRVPWEHDHTTRTLYVNAFLEQVVLNNSGTVSFKCVPKGSLVRGK